LSGFNFSDNRRRAAFIHEAAGQIFCGRKSEKFSQARAVFADGQLV
jgi:hypothetical protein